jgi:hypothetical protein
MQFGLISGINMKSTYCEYILEKILSTSEVGPILALIAPSPLNKILIQIGAILNQNWSTLSLTKSKLAHIWIVIESWDRLNYLLR